MQVFIGESAEESELFWSLPINGTQITLILK